MFQQTDSQTDSQSLLRLPCFSQIHFSELCDITGLRAALDSACLLSVRLGTAMSDQWLISNADPVACKIF